MGPAHLILLGPLFLMKNVIALRLRGDPANGETHFSPFSGPLDVPGQTFDPTNRGVLRLMG